MEEFRPSFRCEGGDRRMEIVSGKSFSCSSNQIYTMNRPRSVSPDLAVVPPRVTRTSQGWYSSSESSSSSSSSSSKPWGFNDPEKKRRRRIARYKVYTIEGRVKASFRNGLRWIKTKCSEIVHGF